MCIVVNMDRKKCGTFSSFRWLSPDIYHNEHLEEPERGGHWGRSAKPKYSVLPGLKKGMVLLAEKGHFCLRNYILRALSREKLHFEGTFAREISL